MQIRKEKEATYDDLLICYLDTHFTTDVLILVRQNPKYYISIQGYRKGCGTQDSRIPIVDRLVVDQNRLDLHHTQESLILNIPVIYIECYHRVLRSHIAAQ